MALATPALIGDRLILRTENHLYSIRKTPKPGTVTNYPNYLRL
jgi:hypothetical protein